MYVFMYVCIYIYTYIHSVSGFRGYSEHRGGVGCGAKRRLQRVVMHCDMLEGPTLEGNACLSIHKHANEGNQTTRKGTSP